MFRLVESQGDADFNSAHQPAYATNRVPRDVIDLSSGVNAIEYMQRVMKALDAGAESSESDEEDGKLVENEEMDVGH